MKKADIQLLRFKTSDHTIQIAYREKIGLGTRAYKLTEFPL